MRHVKCFLQILMCRHLRPNLLAFFAFFLFSHTQFANSAGTDFRLPSLFEDKQRLVLAAPMGVLVLPNQLTIEPNALSQSPMAEQFRPWQPGMSLPTTPEQVVWLRLQLPAQERPQSWMLRIPRLTLHRATLYQSTPSAPQTWTQQQSGLDVPRISWAVQSRDPIFEISTRSDQSQTFFIRLQHITPITEDIQLIHSTDFGNGASYVGTFNGLIIGLFSMLILISLISWRMHRNSHFGWLALLNVSVLLAQLTISGYMNMWIWSNSVFMAKTMLWVMPLFALAVLSRFAISVSYAKDLSKPIYVGLWGLIVVCCLLILSFFVQLEPARVVRNAIYAVGVIGIIGSVSWIAWRSQPWLWLLVLGFSPVVMAVFARLAHNLGWVSHMELALLAGVLSTAVSMVFTYAVLSWQQRQRSSATNREDALETVDIATGLYTERIARARLPQMILRSRQFSHGCGAILIRWVGYKAITENASAVDRGRVFAHLGNRIQRLLRDIDTAARFGDDQFLVLVEGPINRLQLIELASKIVATGLRPSPALPDRKGFELHLAIWLSSEQPADASELLELLKTRISQMEDGTPRRVQFINSAQSDKARLSPSRPAAGSALVEKINALEALQPSPIVISDPKQPSRNDV
jgi:two-component system, sensor histidine kinase LadS